MKLEQKVTDIVEELSQKKEVITIINDENGKLM